jgi:hypothetical protein
VTIRDLTHVVVCAEELRKGDIILHHRAGRVEVVMPTCGGTVAVVTCELGDRYYEWDELVDVYREVVP